MDLGVLADLNSGAYKFTLALHLLAVIAGLGVTLWYGVYGIQGHKRAQEGDAPGAAALAEANAFVASKAEWIIYTIPLWGIGLIMMSDDVWEFSQTWIWLALVLYVIALVNAVTVLQPTGKRIAVLTREIASSPPPAGQAPPQVAELDASGKRLGMFSGINHLILVVILLLMIWKPGL